MHGLCWDSLLRHVEGYGDVRLSDVADVEVIDNSADSYTRLNGEKASILKIYKNATSSAGEVSDNCLTAFKELEKQYDGLHMEGLTVSRFLQILLDAMSQLFFSLSVSMGIMITYGSYVKPEVDLNKAVNQIEIFDTGVALLAGAMIIPAVYVFSGTEGMSAGPSLMFVSLPKVFNAMGKAGVFVGILFFVAAIFATLTSCISVLESISPPLIRTRLPVTAPLSL